MLSLEPKRYLFGIVNYLIIIVSLFVPCGNYSSGDVSKINETLSVLLELYIYISTYRNNLNVCCVSKSASCHKTRVLVTHKYVNGCYVLMYSSNSV